MNRAPRLAALFAAATVVVLAVGLGCWWMLRFEATDPRSQDERVPVEPAPESQSAAPPARDPARPRRRDRVQQAPAVEEEAPAKTEALHRPRVRVVLHGSGDPVAGAKVVATAFSDRREATTDAAGVARFDEPIDGAYVQFDATKPGCMRGHFLADRDDLETAGPIVVELAPGVSMTGVITEDPEGLAVDGARVEAFGVTVDSDRQLVVERVSEAPVAEAVSDANGVFILDDVPRDGKVRLQVVEARHHGFAGEFATNAPRVEVRLKRAGVVRGVVVDPSGAPAPWAVVVVRPQAERWGWRVVATADAVGRYEAGGLALGAVLTITASKPTFADSAAATEIALDPATRAATCDLALRRPARVEVHVLRPDGGSAAGADIRLHTSAEVGDLQATADAAGAHSFDVWSPGDCTLSVEAAGAAADVREIDVAAGARLVVEVRLGAGAALEGRVVDDRGEPVADAELVVDHRSRMRRGKTDETGAFRIEGLATGRHTVEVDAFDHESATLGGVVVPAADALFTLRRLGRVVVRLRIPAGATPPAWVHVTVGGIGSPRFDFSGDRMDVPAAGVPGPQIVIVGAPGFVPVRRTVDLAPGADTRLDEIVLDPGVTVEGRVVDPQGRGLSRATVEVEDHDLEVGTVATDDSGRFRIEHVPARVLAVRASADGYLDLDDSRAFAAGAPPLVVTLSKGGMLRGVVRDAVGAAVCDASVSVRRSGDVTSEAASFGVNESGAFHAQFAVGRYAVTVARGTTVLATKDVELREGEETSVEFVVAK